MGAISVPPLLHLEETNRNCRNSLGWKLIWRMKCCRKIEINFITERKEIRLISSRNQRKRSKLEGTKERGQNWTYLVCGLRASAQNRRTRTPDGEGLKTLVAGDRDLRCDRQQQRPNVTTSNTIHFCIDSIDTVNDFNLQGF
ncbi:hypothetical protein LXL04_035680 [Taraxacum kok-saghyz]